MSNGKRKFCPICWAFHVTHIICQPCPKCGKHGLTWDGRAKVISCLYKKCNHVVRNIVYASSIPTEKELLYALETEANND